MRSRKTGLLGGALVAFAAAAAQAQQMGDPRPPSAPPARSGNPPVAEWGTTAQSILSISAFGFEPFDGNAIAVGNGSAYRYIISGNSCFEAPLSLPTGVIVENLDVEECDSDASSDVQVSIFACPIGGSCTQPQLAASAGNPGCGLVTTGGPSFTIDNSTTTYFVQVCTTSNTANTRFRAARVYYRRQVSPAPASATFGDVSTAHPFFRYVEALAAAGITGGCGGGNYCPDNPVTRGQMAVFLSVALGLHFPN